MQFVWLIFGHVRKNTYLAPAFRTFYLYLHNITAAHIAEAISYRNLDRSNWGQG